MAEKPEDLSLPASVVARIIKDALPEGVSVSKEARVAIGKAASVFILYCTACSNNFALQAKRKTLAASDVLSALSDMEFEEFTPELKSFLEAYKQEQKGKRVAAADRRKQKAVIATAQQQTTTTITTTASSDPQSSTSAVPSTSQLQPTTTTVTAAAAAAVTAALFSSEPCVSTASTVSTAVSMESSSSEVAAVDSSVGLESSGSSGGVAREEEAMETDMVEHASVGSATAVISVS